MINLEMYFSYDSHIVKTNDCLNRIMKYKYITIIFEQKPVIVCMVMQSVWKGTNCMQSESLRLKMVKKLTITLKIRKRTVVKKIKAVFDLFSSTNYKKGYQEDLHSKVRYT